MIPSETNRLPDEVDTVIETLTTGMTVSTSCGGLLVSEGIIPPVVSVTITLSTSPGGLLVPEGIIYPVVSVRHSDSNADYWGMIHSETNRPPDKVDTVIVTLTTGG
jgi:hypothetical protein